MPASPPFPEPIQALRHIHVLVVDDDARISRLVRSVLEALGFRNIEICDSSMQAIGVLETQKVDMVICDWQMQPMSGIELVRYLRRQEGMVNQMVPVIMLSGNTEQPQIEEARDAGVTEYVLKPFTARSLCSRIVAIIERPRDFVISEAFAGHSRRRKTLSPGKERRKKR